MYDYLFRFTDEQEARTVLAEWTVEENRWFAVRALSGIMVTNIVAQQAVVDVDGALITPRVIIPGYWVVISLSEVDDTLYDIVQCVQETSRPEIPTPVAQTIRRTKLTAENYAAFRNPDPVYAGALYIWGG